MSDSISRQALRDAMYHEAFETDTDMQRWDSGCWIRYKLFENVIENLPSTERVGKWIRHSIGHQNTPWGYDCSACGKWFVIGDDTAEQYNYCPNCGARMESDKW